jgi:hypothetical protein
MKIAEEKLKYIIDNSVKRAINEELSVSNIVSQTSDELTDVIINSIANKEYEIVDKNHYYTQIKGNFNYLIFETYKVNVNFTYYNYNNREFYQLDFRSKGPGGASSFEKGMIEVFFHGISGTIDRKELNTVLSHEIEHLYQSFSKKGTLTTDGDNYTTAVKILQDNNVQGLQREVAQVFYYGSNFEQDAFVHELYKTIKDKYITTRDLSLIEKNEAYSILAFLTDFYAKTDFSNDNVDLATYLKPYNRTNSWFEKMIKNSCKRLMTKIGKVIARAQSEYKRDNHIMENFKFD